MFFKTKKDTVCLVRKINNFYDIRKQEYSKKIVMLAELMNVCMHKSP